MIRALFGADSVYRVLGSGLDADLNNVNRIGGRIANATNGQPGSTAQGDFQAALDDQEPINVEEEIVQLVDSAIRYDAETRLLREAYNRLRTAIGRNG